MLDQQPTAQVPETKLASSVRLSSVDVQSKPLLLAEVVAACSCRDSRSRARNSANWSASDNWSGLDQFNRRLKAQIAFNRGGRLQPCWISSRQLKSRRRNSSSVRFRL
jgi:hypothetical protein